MASFTCPAGAICSDQARTFVGATTRTVERVVPGTQGSTKPVTETTGGTGIYHRTVTTVKQDGAGNISGGETVVYIEKNGSWQPAAISKDGGKTYSFSDPKYPTMAGVAGVGLQKELQDPKGAIHKNVDKNVSDALKKAGITKPEDKAKIVDSSKGNGADGATDTGDTSQPFNADTFSENIKGVGRDNFKQPEGPLIYPFDISSTKQDVIKFDMLKYKPKKFDSEKFGFGERERNFTNDSIGTVILPIPSGISDTNAANWNSGEMNAAEVALANVALSGITEGGAGFFSGVEDAAKKVSENAGEVKTAAAAALAGQAANVTGLLSRTTGAIINPNMELLFQAPTLRPFNFTFKMSARNDTEAKTIIKIIRFFKQGMSPQKSSSNLFLKSPHTFKIRYLLRGQNGNEHPYIGKIKECALQSFTVNYTPEGQYATFRDGVLVSYEITMQFQELEPIFNSDYPNDNDASIGY